ncbi:hypothetical protein LZ198_01450 [Myxococcus sp. K15C18031901]|uniref:hypothetical protein n=1 Tax=Myxococcus dinghuensis TaxID=2906761 RepID=UPI0020A81441|nr:hypothetical protein [Myxococcus dinghuensis]MCP3097534.1 hypothetical protein [Myxococcus dinghuensis]
MQRLFSMFPSGAAGIGLLLLRLSVACSLCLDPAGAWSTQTWLAIPGLGLCLGILTPASVLASCLLLLNAVHGMPGIPGPMTAVRLLTACALALLGPGAYSVDARLFGRRVVAFPPSKDKTPHADEPRRED